MDADNKLNEVLTSGQFYFTTMTTFPLLPNWVCRRLSSLPRSSSSLMGGVVSSRRNLEFGAVIAFVQFGSESCSIQKGVSLSPLSLTLCSLLSHQFRSITFFITPCLLHPSPPICLNCIHLAMHMLRFVEQENGRVCMRQSPKLNSRLTSGQFNSKKEED